MGVEREDTQLQPSLVCDDIRLQPPHYRLLSPVPPPALLFVLLRMLQRKITTIGARFHMHWISVSEVIIQ